MTLCENCDKSVDDFFGVQYCYWCRKRVEERIKQIKESFAEKVNNVLR
jgi:uncharacterized protein YdaU (DUF1376 family)